MTGRLLGVTTELRVLILEKLVDGWTLEEAYPETARRRGIDFVTMRRAAEKHGYPDRVAMALALEQLRAEVAAEPAQPAPTPHVEAASYGRTGTFANPTAVPARLTEPPRPAVPAAPQEPSVTATLDRPSPTRPAAAPSATGQLVDLPVGDLVPDPNNPRQDLSGIDELADSMRQTGLLQPVVARRDDRGQLVVVAGHRRLAAAKQLGWATVPTIIRRDLRPDHVLVAMYVENSQRVDLDPIEQARALARIRAQHGNCSVVDLARIVGRGQPHISARLALLALPVEEQEQLRNGELNLGEAVKRARVAAGTARRAGYTGTWYLGAEHSLANQARSRCKRLHTRPRLIGAVACGECWESVIRADERQHIHGHSAKTGTCAICSGPYGSTQGASA